MDDVCFEIGEAGTTQRLISGKECLIWGRWSDAEHQMALDSTLFETARYVRHLTCDRGQVGAGPFRLRGLVCQIAH